MNLVIDTNILFSAILKPRSALARLLIQPGDFNLFAPDFLREEIRNKRMRLAQLSGLSPAEVNKMAELLMERINLVGIDLIEIQTLKNAFDLVRDIDKNDFAFVATTLHLQESILVTGDKVLKEGLVKKGFLQVKTPAQILNL